MKLSLFLLSILPMSCINAEMFFDIRTGKCFTYPASDKINQEKYDNYVEELYWEVLELAEMKKYSNNYIWRIACVNARIRTDKDKNATANQFIEDLESIQSLYEFEDILGLRRSSH